MSPFSQLRTGGRQRHFKPVKILSAGLCMILLAALGAGPVQAEGEVFASLHPCAEDSGGVGSCTANEIDIADATEFLLDLPESVSTCTGGEMLPVREIVAEYGLNTGVRYDPLLWVGRKGNDPREPDEGTGSCYVSSAPAYEGVIFSVEEGEAEDSCLDISNPGVPSVSLPYTNLDFTIECQDADGNGKADVHVLVTWVQNTNLLCGNQPGEVFGTGAPPKCNYSLIQLNLDYLPPPEPSLTVAKVINSDDGGNATLDDFDVSVDGVEVVWDDPSSTTGGSALAAAGAGTFTLSEANVGGYTEGAWSCVDQDEQDIPVTNGGLFSGADVTVAEGQQVTCSITNIDDAPALTLVKSVINDDGGEAEPGDFTLRLDGGIYSDAPFSSGDSPPVVAGTPYTLSEDVFPGYANLGVSCFDEGAEEAVPHPVTLALAQVVTCTLTNDDIGEGPPPPVLTLLKSVTNDNGGDAEPGDFQLRLDGGIYSDAPFSSGDTPPVAAGTPYTLSEDAFPGYAATGVSCFDEGAEEVVPHPVTLSDGQVVTCTIGNDDVAPELTVILQVINDEGGTAAAGDWTIVVTADNPSDNGFPGAEAPGTTITIDAGSYSVDATDGPDGYVETPSGDCAGDLEIGESAVCTITADDIPLGLTVRKIIVSDNGGAATLDDFDVAVEGAEVTWSDPSSTTGGVELVATEPGTYTLSEAAVDGYEAGAWACSDLDGSVPVTNGGAFDGADVTVEAGQHVLCSITNDDLLTPTEQSLEVTKIIVSDNGGTATVDDFDVSVDGVEVHWWHPDSATGDTEIVADLPGTYRLSEADVEGYEEGRWTCNDEFGEVPVTNEGLFSGADVTVAPGQHVRCSITNNDVFVPVPGLIVQKIIRAENGGTATLDDFDVSVNGFEVDWEDPGSMAGGSRFVSGKPGTYTLSEMDLDGYMEGRWSCTDAKYRLVPVSNDGHFSGADVVVEPEQQVTCTITNNDEKLRPDVSVTKRTDPDIGECGVIVGQHLDFSIEAANAGPGVAEGVILEDHWSWQLKLSGAPDMIECTDPKERWIRCKLGNMEAGASKEVSIGFMVGGNPGEEACNLARVSTYPNDYGDPADNEAEVCFDLVGKLMLATAPGCGELPMAVVGVPYDESIAITGGQRPYSAEFEGLPEDFAGTVVDGKVRIQGCALEPGAREFTVTLADRAGCQDTREEPAVCTLTVIQDPDCPMSDLAPSAVPPGGAPTPDPDVLPDESAQKVVVDVDRNRYLVGFAYRDHSYGTDPNGPYVDHPRNYDIRVVKYDDAGRLIWDKTYDTGNDDYGYAIALDSEADQPGLFVGGGVEVETGPHAWHEALLLEIDPATGCPAGTHFQSAGKGTTSAFYDIATDGNELYAVGERQRNEQLVGEFGALISIFSHAGFAGPDASCEGDHHIIGYPPPAGSDPALITTLVREGGFVPTVAYSVELPGPECVDCAVLVGGRSEAGGWVDAIVGGGNGLATFLAPGLLGDISVQDLAVPGDHVIVVGSSSENDMRVLGYDRAGSTLWAPKDLGKGRLRGVAVDASGAFYAVGRSDDENSAGLIFKFDMAGGEIDRDRLTQGSGTSFTDVAIFGPGNGLIAGRNDESQFDYTWFQIEFDCAGGACSPSGD